MCTHSDVWPEIDFENLHNRAPLFGRNRGSGLTGNTMDVRVAIQLSRWDLSTLRPTMH